MTKHHNPPKLAAWLIERFTPKHHQDALLGDLYEEYFELKEQNLSIANRWFWLQTYLSGKAAFYCLLTNAHVIKTLVFSIGLGVFTIIALLVMWLSSMDNVDGFSDGFWQSLLNGNVHLALLEGAFWSGTPDYIMKSTNEGIWQFIGLFIHLPALILASASLIAIHYLSKTASLKSLIFSSVSLVLMPYLYGLLLLNNYDYAATQTGPILASMLLSVFYLVLPSCYFIAKRFRTEHSQIWQSDS
ncbi:hypothetical protein [Pseudoalteromonas sp. G4]|uniref:hypothetical protein n=1 Tax=Pseudoalteromonas sp. G4 TaxID=2992761 RepID=UPI00237D4FB8|nr:hypothetical protein [Pseudoalteromonas sp. G4]MDE3272098.1 hypothetical protein [Pseudoalteromonas sp. G4]